MDTLKRIDRFLDLGVSWLCNGVLLAMTLIVLYSVVLRYLFNDPPFWSDVLSTLGNVALVLFGLSVAIRRRDHIAMQAVYEKISPVFALVLDGFWNVLVLIFAVIFTVFGAEAAWKVPGFYWELNMMPEKVPMAMIPISGALLIIASIGVLIQDIRKFYTLKDRAASEAT